MSTQTSNSIVVTEFKTFEAAWKAAIETRESYTAFQNMNQKIFFIKKADRWFVDGKNEIWYSYMTSDGLRIVKRAEVSSILSNGNFQYIQIMVPMSGQGTLRFTGQYVNRMDAISYSAKSEVFAFNK
jgi:hypothetical protein